MIACSRRYQMHDCYRNRAKEVLNTKVRSKWVRYIISESRWFLPNELLWILYSYSLSSRFSWLFCDLWCCFSSYKITNRTLTRVKPHCCRSKSRSVFLDNIYYMSACSYIKIIKMIHLLYIHYLLHNYNGSNTMNARISDK